jgi:hypothetical protein
VAIYFKAVLFGQASLGLMQQLHLFADKILVIYYLPAGGADQVVMVPLGASGVREFIARFIITGVELADQAQFSEKFEGAVDGSQAEIRMAAVGRLKDFFSGKMLSALFKGVKHGVPGGGDTAAEATDLSAAAIRIVVFAS